MVKTLDVNFYEIRKDFNDSDFFYDSENYDRIYNQFKVQREAVFCFYL